MLQQRLLCMMAVMDKHPPYISLFMICLLLWLLLTASFRLDAIITGVVASSLVSVIAAPRLQLLKGMKLSLEFLPALFRYLFYFLIALIRANFDVARKVISFPLKIEPRMIAVETRMQSDLGKLLLANSITLTPGTLSVHLKENCLQIHWMDMPESDIQKQSEAVVREFEQLLTGFVR